MGTVTAVLADTVRRGVTHARPVNLAFGTRVSLLDLIDVVEGQLGTSVAREHLEPRVGDVRDSQADQSTLHELFPDVRPVALEEGIARTIAWFQGSE